MTESTDIQIVPADADRVAELAAVHVAAFPGEFLTLLGRGCLQAFYRYTIRRPEGICLVAVEVESGRTVGLVAGGAPELRSRFLRAHVLRLLGTALVKGFVHRHVRRRLWEHVCGGLRAIGRKAHVLPTRAAEPEAPTEPPGTWSNLLSICAHPAARGRGVGKALMEGWRRESARRGYKTMRLSVHNDNEAAIALYRRCGWQPVLTTPNGTYFKRSVEEDE